MLHMLEQRDLLGYEFWFNTHTRIVLKSLTSKHRTSSRKSSNLAIHFFWWHEFRCKNVALLTTEKDTTFNLTFIYIYWLIFWHRHNLAPIWTVLHSPNLK